MLALGASSVACKRAERAAPTELQLARHPPVVGERQTLSDRLDSNSRVIAEPGKATDLVTHRVRELDLEVLAVTPEGVVTSARVHFRQHHVEQSRDGVDETKPSPLEGQTYVVTAEGDQLTAVHPDGSAATAAEQAALVVDLGRAIGKVPPLTTLLTSHAWRSGEPVTLTPPELADAFGRNPMMQPVAGAALLVGVVAGVATFEFDLTLARDDAEGRVESPMRMTVKVDVAHSRPIEMTLIGTLSGKVAGMDSTGSVEGRVTYAYQ
ncbi:MAG: hypothetical protein IPL61_08900 [Myxococcales bacterium]|nr:hypothetical protein [Myxococcales bacterium]